MNNPRYIYEEACADECVCLLRLQSTGCTDCPAYVPVVRVVGCVTSDNGTLYCEECRNYPWGDRLMPCER